MHTPARYRTILLLIPLALACGPGDVAKARPAAPAVLEAGWTGVIRPEWGFSIGLPPGWRLTDRRNQELRESFGEFGKVVEALNEGQQEAREMKGYVLESANYAAPVQPGDSRPRLIVMRQELKDDVDYKDAVAECRERLEKGVGFPRIIQQETVELPIGRAERFVIATQFGSEDDVRDLYMVRDGKVEYLLYVVAPAKYEVATKMFGRKVAETFRVLSKP